MTNRELINTLKEQSCRVNAMKAKEAYRTIADELLRQIPEAVILRTKPFDLLEPGIPGEPQLYDNYSGVDLFYYHFMASLPNGRALRIRVDNSLERFRVYRYYWLNTPVRIGENPYVRESHISYDSMVCNRSNSSIKATLAKLALRELRPDAQPLTPQQLQEYLDDQYND